MLHWELNSKTTNKANMLGLFFFKIEIEKTFWGRTFLGLFFHNKGLFFYQSSPSFSLAGTSMTLGLSMIRAVRWPFSTIPIIQAWYPSCFSMSWKTKWSKFLAKFSRKHWKFYQRKLHVEVYFIYQWLITTYFNFSPWCQR